MSIIDDVRVHQDIDKDGVYRFTRLQDGGIVTKVTVVDQAQVCSPKNWNLPEGACEVPEPCGTGCRCVSVHIALSEQDPDVSKRRAMYRRELEDRVKAALALSARETIHMMLGYEPTHVIIDELGDEK